MRLTFIALVFGIGIVCSNSRIYADLISPDSVVPSSEYLSPNFDGRAIHTIDGSGLPANFTAGDPHAAYASGNHWTTTGGPPSNEFIVWSFTTPQSIDAIVIWNHQSTRPPADNSGYDVTQFNLTLFDSSSNPLLTLNNNPLLPDTATGQVFNFGGAISNVSSIRIDIAAVQSSPSYTGLAEVAFNRAEVPGPSSILASLVHHASYSGAGTPPWNRLDTSKTLIKEGTKPQLLTYDNLINTAQGINGIIFDIENLPEGDGLGIEDFQFQVSPQGAFDAGANPPANWQSAPDPSSITVTPGTPDRVLIQWPDQSIMNRWLRITVLANEETGLAEPETYYIGHLLGETTGPSDGTFTVSFADITPIRADVGQTVDASSDADIDKNGTVSFADISAMRGNVGSQLTQISVP